MEKEYYKSVNGLKGFAAIGILTMHVLLNGNYKLTGFIFENIISKFGHFVLLFLIISAFGMCCGYYERILHGNISMVVFYSKRIKKIWPFFAILVIFNLCLEFNIENFYMAFARLTLCYSLLPNPNITIIGVAGTLGVIFLFYMLFPFFCYMIRSKRSACVALVISALFHYLCINYFFDAEHIGNDITFDPRNNIIYCAMFFFAGGNIYLFRDNIKKIPKLAVPILMIIEIILGYFFFVIPEMKIELIRYVELLFFSTTLILAIRKPIYLLENKCISFISSISMEIYLSHMLIYRIIEKLHLLYLCSNNILNYIISVVLVFSGTVIFASLGQKIISKLITIKKEKKNV